MPLIFFLNKNKQKQITAKKKKKKKLRSYYAAVQGGSVFLNISPIFGAMSFQPERTVVFGLLWCKILQKKKLS